MKSPCMNCNVRHMGCHSKCRLYEKYKNELEIIGIKKDEESDFMSYLCRSIEKMKESRG